MMPGGGRAKRLTETVQSAAGKVTAVAVVALVVACVALIVAFVRGS
jgi:hypothetical protein